MCVTEFCLTELFRLSSSGDRPALVAASRRASCVVVVVVVAVVVVVVARPRTCTEF